MTATFSSALVLILSLTVLTTEGYDWSGRYPGTKWCGKGNSGPGLGSLNKVDACCRTHDQCSRKVKGFKAATFPCFSYVLINPTPFVWSDCNCDHKFKNCLKNVGGSQRHHANAIGVVYFNVLRNLNHKCINYNTCCTRYKFTWRGIKCSRRGDKLSATSPPWYV